MTPTPHPPTFQTSDACCPCGDVRLFVKLCDSPSVEAVVHTELHSHQDARVLNTARRSKHSSGLFFLTLAPASFDSFFCFQVIVSQHFRKKKQNQNQQLQTLMEAAGATQKQKQKQKQKRKNTDLKPASCFWSVFFSHCCIIHRVEVKIQ